MSTKRGERIRAVLVVRRVEEIGETARFGV
jgi:hypothetical protein